MTLMIQEQNDQVYYYLDDDENGIAFPYKNLPEQYSRNSIFLSIEVIGSRKKRYCQLYKIIDDFNPHDVYCECILVNLTDEDLTHLTLLDIPVRKVCTDLYKEAISKTIEYGFYYHDFD